MEKIFKLTEEEAKLVERMCDSELHYKIHENGCAADYESEIQALLLIFGQLNPERADEYSQEFNEIVEKNAQEESTEEIQIEEEEREYIRKLAGDLYDRVDEYLTKEEFVSSYVEKARVEGANNIIAELKDKIFEQKKKWSFNLEEKEPEKLVE